MRVNVIDIVQTGDGEVLRCSCDLAECFPDDPESCRAALDDIEREGECWIGGGAAPITVLRKATS